MPDLIVTKTSEDVLELCINRPDKKNALTNAMYGGLADALERANSDGSIRCVLISGAGGDFTSGNDLSDFAAVAAGTLKWSDMQVGRFLSRIAAFDKPLVAAVRGVAIGIGTTMLLHCDLVYLDDTAVLAAPFVDLGLVPEAASSRLLPERIGYVRAFGMFALGERLTAEEAHRLGLANAVIPSGELLPKARAAAVGLAAKAPNALVATKRLMRLNGDISRRIDMENDMFNRQLLGPEAREALAAHRERRPAKHR